MSVTPQATPQFSSGGTVFGRTDTQWNQYFAAKVDAENGTADNLSVTGMLTLNGFIVVPINGAQPPLQLSSGTLSLSYAGPLTLNGSGALSISNNGINNSLLRQGSGTSVIGRSANSLGNVADIAGTANQFLVVNSTGTALAFTSMSGDATLSGGVITVSNNAITTAKINAAAVTYAKVQNGASNGLLGVNSGGAPTEVSVSTGLLLSGGALTNTSAATVPTTWTPTDASGASLSLTITDARYIKIGQLVIIEFAITWPSTSDGSNALVGGLPFTSFNGTVAVGGGGVSFTNQTNPITMLVANNGVTMAPFSASGIQFTNVLLSGKVIKGTIMYMSAS